MKKILLSGLVLMFGLYLQAQESAQLTKASERSAQLAQLYQLNDEQTDRMMEIQTRRYQQLDEIAALEEVDYPLYVKKMKAIRSGADLSIQMMLNEEQMKTFYQQSIERRKAIAEIARSMQEQGATPQEIEKAQLRLE